MGHGVPADRRARDGHRDGCRGAGPLPAPARARTRRMVCRGSRSRARARARARSSRPRLSYFRHIPAGMFLAINVSATTAMSTALRDHLAAIPGNRIVLELTEHDRIEDYETVWPAFDELRTQGVRIAVDDAGTGYSGLQHILRVQPDIVKLDLALTHEIHVDPARRARLAVSSGSCPRSARSWWRRASNPRRSSTRSGGSASRGVRASASDSRVRCCRRRSQPGSPSGRRFGPDGRGRVFAAPGLRRPECPTVQLGLLRADRSLGSNIRTGVVSREHRWLSSWTVRHAGARRSRKGPARRNGTARQGRGGVSSGGSLSWCSPRSLA